VCCTVVKFFMGYVVWVLCAVRMVVLRLHGTVCRGNGGNVCLSSWNIYRVGVVLVNCGGSR